MTRDSDRPEDDGQGGFLSRWSRRKAEAREEKPVEQPAETNAGAEEEVEIDPETLPPIETLTEASDFSVFLKKGVPPALRAAALRKLWLVEPSVVNYQPLVEYNWDFTAPGYGDFMPGEDIAKYVKTVFEGSLPKSDEAAPETGTVLPQEPPHLVAEAVPEELPAEAPEVARDESAAESVPVYAPPRRRHGGALPD
ncbi:MAG: DUF3306 domain-containing protein [Ferrovibrio sp.]|uniref:DUF3306 domain-containing protein n=1 Tax=Ferrovibrio sp. TaxID=1917215 RepID=UPI00391A0820